MQSKILIALIVLGLLAISGFGAFKGGQFYERAFWEDAQKKAVQDALDEQGAKYKAQLRRYRDNELKNEQEQARHAKTAQLLERAESGLQACERHQSDHADGHSVIVGYVRDDLIRLLSEARSGAALPENPDTTPIIGKADKITVANLVKIAETVITWYNSTAIDYNTLIDSCQTEPVETQ